MILHTYMLAMVFSIHAGEKNEMTLHICELTSDFFNSHKEKKK